MSITLRRAKVDDLKQMTELAMRSKQSNGYDDAFMAACREELTVTEAHLTMGEYWVAEISAKSGALTPNRLCGSACLVFNVEQRSAEVHAFFINPDHQRQGIGRLLWGKLLMRARQAGVLSVHLDADPNAVGFYAAMGFEVVGQSPSGSIEGRFLPKMTLQIEQS